VSSLTPPNVNSLRTRTTMSTTSTTNIYS